MADISQRSHCPTISTVKQQEYTTLNKGDVPEIGNVVYVGISLDFDFRRKQHCIWAIYSDKNSGQKIVRFPLRDYTMTTVASGFKKMGGSCG